jgi:hypothetical protein
MNTMTEPTRIGRYEIVRRIGRSMTDVYLAIDTVENRKAALKLVKQDGDKMTQLVLEAERRGAAIQKELRVLDPRVVEIYDFGDSDGYFFVAMQYVEGRSLGEVLQAEGVIDPTRAATIALEICEQLVKFHSQQAAVVHGDIKPSNIHLGMHETVRLLDFGIAKTLRANGCGTNHNFGSPSYCSPERLARSEVDQQSDLWAVGATLYEMLAGTPPYQADSTLKLESLIRSHRPPRALSPACPRALRLVTMKALAPKTERRYRSAREFQGDLQAFLERRPTLAELEKRGWSANATIEAARECLRKATRTLRRAKRRLRIAGAVGWFAVGMGLWIGGTLGWQAWRTHRTPPPPAAKPAPPKAPATLPGDGMALLYQQAAERILDAYRSSSDPALQDFDWTKAEICLQRAVELGGDSARTFGELALSKGYATLERLGGERYSDGAAAQLREYAREQFGIAALKMPHDPAPHLALARFYVYSQPNAEKAMEEFSAVGQMGGTLGRREIEQQADVYRIEAQQELSDEPKQAVEDAQTARALYQKISGYDRADEHLREVTRIITPVVKRAKTVRQRRWR